MVCFIQPMYSVRWIAQRALHFTSWQKCSFRHQLDFSGKHSSQSVFTPYDDIRLHVALFYTPSADSPFSLISSFTLPNHLLLCLPLFLLPCTFIIIAQIRPPSYMVFLSSHHMPIPLQPSFLYFVCDFRHFRCPSYYFIYDLVQLRNSAHPL